jgi:hypothetical protein
VQFASRDSKQKADVIIKGNRRGGALQLAAHLLRRDTNENVLIREIEGYPAQAPTDQDLRTALRIMETQANAQGRKRTLYHAIIAPQEGEILTGGALARAVETLASNLELSDHPRVIVEHRKAGRQHFHVVFNILSADGKQARLQWTRKKEWATARQLEQELGLKPVLSKGRSARRWECERGKRSGLDPLKTRQEITKIYQQSSTTEEFMSELKRAGYTLCRGRRKNLVLLDRAGHVHGLMRRIEGAKLGDLLRKFPELTQANLPPLEILHKAASDQKGTALGRIYRPATHCPLVPSPAPTFDAQLRHGHSSFPRDARNADYEERIAAFRAMAVTFGSRPAAETSNTDPLPVRPSFDNRDAESARIIAWAFRNGRLDVLSLYGIFLPTNFFG